MWPFLFAMQYPTPEALVGLWRMDLWIGTQVELPVFGVSKVASHQVVLGRIEAGADGLEMVHEVCLVEAVPRGGLSKTVIPLAFSKAVPVRRYPITVEVVDGVLRYTADPGPMVVGYDPVASGGRVPTSAEDPAVRDFEGDGKPAATFLVELPLGGMGEVSTVQSSRTRYAGRGAAARIDGTLQVRDLVQQTVGASNRLFAISPKVSADPANSTFLMTRAPAGTTCERLRGG